MFRPNGRGFLVYRSDVGPSCGRRDINVREYEVVGLATEAHRNTGFLSFRVRVEADEVTVVRALGRGEFGEKSELCLNSNIRICVSRQYSHSELKGNYDSQ